MPQTPSISEKLRQILNDLERVTDEAELRNARNNVSNDDLKPGFAGTGK